MPLFHIAQLTSQRALHVLQNFDKNGQTRILRLAHEVHHFFLIDDRCPQIAQVRAGLYHHSPTLKTDDDAVFPFIVEFIGDCEDTANFFMPCQSLRI